MPLSDLTLMRRHGLGNFLSHDSDFDRVPSITRCVPAQNKLQFVQQISVNSVYPPLPRPSAWPGPQVEPQPLGNAFHPALGAERMVRRHGPPEHAQLPLREKRMHSAPPGLLPRPRRLS